MGKLSRHASVLPARYASPWPVSCWGGFSWALSHPRGFGEWGGPGRGIYPKSILMTTLGNPLRTDEVSATFRNPTFSNSERVPT